MPTGKIRNYSPFFRQFLFLGTLIALALILFGELKFFIGAFLGALTLYILLRGPFFRLTEKYRWRAGIASLTLVLLASIVLLALGFLVFKVIASEIPNIDASRVMIAIKKVPGQINHLVGFAAINDQIFSRIPDFLSEAASRILSSTYSFAANIFMMLVILYFMLAYARWMENKATTYIPFKGQSFELLKHEVRNMIYSNAIGIPLVMLSQGLTAGLIYWIFGFNNVIFWAFLTALCGLLPMVGTVIVSAPLGIFLISNGEVWSGIVLIACGLIIIANVDNLVRIVFLQKVANTPPLVVIFGVILGIPLFGFWGIIFGPLLISAFLLLIKIYYVEYNLLDAEKAKTGRGHRSPGEKAVHKVLRMVQGKAGRSALHTPVPCNPDGDPEVCDIIRGEADAEK